MIIQIIILLFTMLVLPATFIFSLWKANEPTQFSWLIKAAYSGVFLLYLFLFGRWDFISVYLRWLWMALFLLALIVSFLAVKDKPFFDVRGPRNSITEARSGLFTLVLFLFFLGMVVRGSFYSAEPVRLEFPLREGRYYIGHGGNSWIVNAHNSSNSQRYALDIVALNPIGMRASGLLPAQNEKYAIFDHVVVAPCDGQVTEVVDGLPDLTPPQMDPENPAGNYVVIACPGADVILAHLRSGSVMVQPGNVVAVAQPVGRVGNSGNTSEPHLHMHALKPGTGAPLAGEGIPILFDDRFLVRNNIVEP